MQYVVCCNYSISKRAIHAFWIVGNALFSLLVSIVLSLKLCDIVLTIGDFNEITFICILLLASLLYLFSHISFIFHFYLFFSQLHIKRVNCWILFANGFVDKALFHREICDDNTRWCFRSKAIDIIISVKWIEITWIYSKCVDR